MEDEEDAHSTPFHPPPHSAVDVEDAVDFEFAWGGGEAIMAAADELFFEGKLLPFWETRHGRMLKKSISMKKDRAEVEEEKAAAWAAAEEEEEEEEPSPRLPKCTVLWKELLKLRRQKSAVSSSLSTSSSTSSSSSNEGERGRKGVKKLRPMPVCSTTPTPHHPKPSLLLPFLSFRDRRSSRC